MLAPTLVISTPAQEKLTAEPTECKIASTNTNWPKNASLPSEEAVATQPLLLLHRQQVATFPESEAECAKTPPVLVQELTTADIVLVPTTLDVVLHQALQPLATFPASEVESAKTLPMLVVELTTADIAQVPTTLDVVLQPLATFLESEAEFAKTLPLLVVDLTTADIAQEPTTLDVVPVAQHVLRLTLKLTTNKIQLLDHHLWPLLL